MTFTSKNIQSRKNSMGFLKGATLFFLGLSGVLFVTTAFNIAPIAPNAIQYIKTIFLTASGNNTSATGIILEGLGGDGRFKNSVTVNNLPSVVVVGTNASGKLISSTSGAVYNYISGYIGGTNTEYRALSGTNIYKTNIGNVGIGITDPTQPLQVIGNILGGDISNSISGNLSSVVGGSGNTIDASDYVFVGGGISNAIESSDSKFSSIVGGSGNRILSDSASFIGGGDQNIIGTKIGSYNAIVGGQGNHIYGENAIIASIIGGGNSNTIYDGLSFIGGGELNTIQNKSGKYNSIIGGLSNNITGKNAIIASIIGGGFLNTIYDSNYGFIGGGSGNRILGADPSKDYANIIMGGSDNSMISKGFFIKNSTIAGGYGNKIVTESSDIDSSFVAGYQAVAKNTNTFVRNSDTSTTFESARPYTFLINAPRNEKQGGVGINTNNPKAALDVNGSIVSNGSISVSNNITVGGDMFALNGTFSNSLSAGGNIDAAGYSVGGTPGMTANVSVQNGPTGDPCTLNFEGGILTATNCYHTP